jgi:hypothetical protein
MFKHTVSPSSSSAVASPPTGMHRPADPRPLCFRIVEVFRQAYVIPAMHHIWSHATDRGSES